MNSVGSLVISARYAAGAVVDLDVRLERPEVARLFIGQAPETVVKTVPYLYTLCAQAQRAAAQAALAAACGEAPRPADSPALWGEALHEHLWRLFLDWPAALGLPPAKDALVAWRNARHGDAGAAATAAAFTQLVGQPMDAWNGRPAFASLAGRCLERLGGIGECREFDLPPLTPENWLAYWQDKSAGEPATMTPPSVADAYWVRLQEAVGAARALAAGRPYPVQASGGGGWGVGQTLTARGVLTHGARVRLGRVIAYRVWAPTDCHFARPDDVAALVAGRRPGDWQEARQVLEQAVLALDPCLPYEVRMSHA